MKRGNYLYKLTLNTFFIFINAILFAQTPCLDIQVTNLACIPDDTPNNPYDDTYSFNIEINGGSTGWKAEIANASWTGSYGQTTTISSLSISDGPLFLFVYDSINPQCNNYQTIIPPHCSTCNNTLISSCTMEQIELKATARNLWGYENYTAFQWYRDGVLIPGATDSIFNVSMSGVYTIRGYNTQFNVNPSCYSESCCSFTITSDGTQSATDDLITNQCPGLDINGNVSWNDVKSIDSKYALIAPTTNGVLTFDSTGYFLFQPSSFTCLSDQFTYQLCDTNGGCCDTATVTIDLSDTILPYLINIPADDTIHCDEQLPQPPIISAIDNCPAISINVEKLSTQGEDGCSLYDYTLTRIWTATDICGNNVSDEQIVEIRDITAPDIFRIYTLPNGKKLVAGVMENVNQNWKTISLPIDFSTTPLVFTQTITTNESIPVATRIRNVSTAQFELKLQEEEGEDNKHVRENVAWIAIEAGNQTADFPLEAQRISLTNAWEIVDFDANYTVFPSFFGQIQTINDIDPAGLRFRNPSLNSIQIQIEEESSVNADVTHQSEEIAFLGIEHGINLTDERGVVFGETGSVSVDEQWITVTTNQTYYNPVVLAGIPQHLGGDPGVVRIRNVRANSFDIRFEEWNYRDGGHAFEYISYLVMEGSLPLDASIMCELGTDSLEIGKDIITIDNCDINVALQYKETEVIEGNARQIIRTWYAEDECGNATGLSQIVPCTGIGLQLKVMLQGAMLGNEEYGLMRDDLRRKSLLPTKEPYTTMPSFDHVGAGGGEECLPELFDIIGEKAIVDWVFVELKQADNPEATIATCAALLQRNGQVINEDGDSILYFEHLPPDNYYVAIRHRNHLKVETLYPYLLTETNTPFIDFTFNFLPTIGFEPFTEIEGGNAIWSGDLNQDERTIFQGPNNDIFQMFLHVILDSLNQNYLTNFISSGYTENDFNLDGSVIYQGPNNDRSNLLFNTILAHPNNANRASNYVLSTQGKENENLETCQTDKSLEDCDFDNDGKLNRTDADDDNDGVVDGNDIDPYNANSDSDGDGLNDKLETQTESNPLNACDPFQDHDTCQGKDEDGDGKFGNYPSEHSLYDENDLDACIPNPQAINCSCSDDDNDGYIFICHTTENGQNQTLKITLAQWRLRQIIGDTCGKCQN